MRLLKFIFAPRYKVVTKHYASENRFFYALYIRKWYWRSYRPSGMVHRSELAARLEMAKLAYV